MIRPSSIYTDATAASYQREPPAPHVTEKLLRPDKEAYFVPASDDDELFGDLCRFLDVPRDVHS